MCKQGTGAAMAEQKVAVIVGAGPAGCAVASSLAQRGWAVSVYERRPRFHEDASKNSRTYPMNLSGRALTGMRAAGLSMDNATFKKVRMEGVYNNGFKLVTRKPGNADKDCFYLVDRMSLGYEMYQEAANQQYPGSITWHFSSKLISVDFDNRTAVFSIDGQENGSDGGAVNTAANRMTAHYDLLLGCDGYNSAVRKELVGMYPSITSETVLHSSSTYKTFHGLEMIPEADKFLEGVSEHLGRQFLYVFRSSKTGIFVLGWKQLDGTWSGLFSSPAGYDEAHLRKQIPLVCKGIPNDWLESILQQVKADGSPEPYPFGRIVKVSQLHGPFCVLLGDAGHAVTSTLGQGCNMALESVKIFMEVLDTVGLEEAPETFNRIRINDVHCLQAMEFCSVVAKMKKPSLIRGELRMPTMSEWFKANMFFTWSSIPFHVARMLFPKKFRAPTLFRYLLSNPDLTYSQVLRTIQVQSGIVIAAGLTAVLGSTALAATLITGTDQGSAA